MQKKNVPSMLIFQHICFLTCFLYMKMFTWELIVSQKMIFHVFKWLRKLIYTLWNVFENVFESYGHKIKHCFRNSSINLGEVLASEVKWMLFRIIGYSKTILYFIKLVCFIKKHHLRHFFPYLYLLSVLYFLLLLPPLHFVPHLLHFLPPLLPYLPPLLHYLPPLQFLPAILHFIPQIFYIVSSR